jgi:hypothetical protein
MSPQFLRHFNGVTTRVGDEIEILAIDIFDRKGGRPSRPMGEPAARCPDRYARLNYLFWGAGLGPGPAPVPGELIVFWPVLPGG